MEKQVHSLQNMTEAHQVHHPSDNRVSNLAAMDSPVRQTHPKIPSRVLPPIPLSPRSGPPYHHPGIPRSRSMDHRALSPVPICLPRSVPVSPVNANGKPVAPIPPFPHGTFPIATEVPMPHPPEPSERQKAMESAVAAERERAKELEPEEAKMAADELRAVLKMERRRTAKILADLAAFKLAAVELQSEAEVIEEGRINGLMRRLDHLQHEKGRIIFDLEREEEMVSHTVVL